MCSSTPAARTQLPAAGLADGTEFAGPGAAGPPRGEQADLPRGTVTFLFTDVEGSTARWERDPAGAAASLARQEAISRQAVAAHGGVVFKTVGDQVCAAFAVAADALAAAVAAQTGARRARTGARPGRCGCGWRCTPGRPRRAPRGDYPGPPLNRVARLLAAAHGGQVLLSRVAAGLVRDGLPAGVTLRDLGEHRLRDLDRPERVFQAVIPGLPTKFPPLRRRTAGGAGCRRRATP